MLKKVSVILLALLITFLQLPPIKAYALVEGNELKVSSELTQWVLDESTNTLYAISEAGKSLLCINATTMNVEKTITFPGNPTDIIKDNGKLYVSLDNINQIVIIDMATRTITEKIYTTSDPYRIVKDGDKIYYAEYDQHCAVYEYDLNSATEKIVVGSVYQPDLAINSKEHLLYIGESGSSGSDLYYYSTAENKIVGVSNYDDNYGFPYAKRNIFFDGTNVYYSGRDFKLDDPRRFNGDFGNCEDVLYVNKGLVFTRENIFNKDTHVKLGAYGFNATLIEATDHSLYIYNKENGTVKRFNNSDALINSNNIKTLISGNPATPIQDSTEAIKIHSGMSVLEMNSKLEQWELDESNNMLYGISKSDKALFFMNAESLNIEKAITFTCGPTDIFRDNGILYVALDDANQIAVIDLATKTVIKTLYTKSDPYRLVKDGDKIYYAERDQHCRVYEYNLTTNVDNTLPLSFVYQPDLAINTNDHILYIGESDLSGSDMYYYSTTENRIIGQTYYQGYGFPYPSRNIVFDGEKVYYAGFDFDKLYPTILGSYGENIILAKYGVAFSKTSLYETETYTLLENFGEGLNLFELSSQGVIYLYSEADKAIIKIDPNKMPYVVMFDSQGGSEVELIFADPNTKITVPTPPTRQGYTFAGWYKEPECINPWDFEKDVVTEDTMLYAKWTIGSYTVTFNSQGGSAVAIKTAKPNTTITAPTTPVKLPYTFDGWFKEPECKNPWNFETDKVTSNITLYAKWILKEDINLDGYVDILDIAELGKKYNITKDQSGWKSNYDLNNDGIVDIYDIVSIARTLEYQYPRHINSKSISQVPIGNEKNSNNSSVKVKEFNSNNENLPKLIFDLCKVTRFLSDKK